MWIYHISFIYCLFDGQLGCFQFLLIMCKAAMNIDEEVSLWKNGVSLGYMTKLDIEVNWFPILWVITILICILTEQLCTPSNNKDIFSLLYILCQNELSLSLWYQEFCLAFPWLLRIFNISLFLSHFRILYWEFPY